MLKNVGRIIILTAVMLTLNPISAIHPVNAQSDVTVLSYGQTIEGQITADTAQIEYGFTGKQNEIVILRMDSAPGDSGLKTPAFKVFRNQNILIDSTKIFTLSLTIGYAVFQLPADDDYRIVATHRESKTSNEIGTFVLSLNNATPLEANMPINDELNDKTDKYYVIDASGAFMVSYSLTRGKFRPGIYVSAIKPAGVLEPAAELSGLSLDSATMTITPQNGVRYLVRITKAFLSSSVGSAQYAITFCPESCATK